MPKILWQNDRNEMTRRRANQMIRRGMVEGEGDQQKAWDTYRDAQAGLSEGQIEEQDAALRDQGLETSRAGLSIGEQEALPDDPRYGAMHSGPTKGGDRDDFRTDAYLVDAAREGKLKGFNDARSRDYKKTYGKGGPLYDRYTYEELAANPELRTMREMLLQAATPNRGIGSDTKPYVSLQRDSWFDRTPEPHKAVQAYKAFRGGR